MKAQDILLQYHLKCTACRVGIIEVLQHSDTALSEAQIKKTLPNQFDRTTFYRSFKTLVEHKVLHAIALHEETLYMLNQKENNPQKDHYHFYCSQCHKVMCIEPVKEEISLPKGFEVRQAEIMMKGTCEKCNQ